ncbi:NAD(P)/FAD-dependent oxidoreductase [Methylovirgula sp. 4M-Z18]|uniref:NAD(P)/FAD-dependent oxidoreductase n=1 Tax=Methylovirgula sp. 4M-Z18 TaxID=2293567 RepID=UPI001FE17D97|nr:FAD-dependent oxidoreductase [Methylovirgula sp. 4M-Z18]
MTFKADVAVLGAGMVGVSTALHLQAKGRSVVLIDRNGEAGEETSYGNAGIIERSSIFPYMFPRNFNLLRKYALNALPEAHYHVAAVPKFLPWLVRYFGNSSHEMSWQIAMASRPLIENCLVEHKALMAQAGAEHLLRDVGWLKVFRTQRSMDQGVAEVARLKPFGINYRILDAASVRALEPHLDASVIGGIHLLDPGFVPDPGALVKAYAALFEQRGGDFVKGDARTLGQDADGWGIDTEDGRLHARDAVIALGPWSDDVFKPLGYKLPLSIKRGYHLHFTAQGGATLNRPIYDADGGYVLAPMTRGIRLTTGAEFAARDAEPTPVQIEMTEPAARKLFPLEHQIEDVPWMGRRPCMPDMLPVIGRAPKHSGLWFNFGHQHHGFTLGPVSGRLLAEMITGEKPFTDPMPYAAERFG